MPRIRHQPCPRVVKQFGTTSEVLEHFTMKDTNHRWAGACGVLHDKQGQCRVATDASTVFCSPYVKPMAGSQVYAYRRIPELDLYKGDPLVVYTFPPYVKAFEQPRKRLYTVDGAYLTQVLSRLTRQCLNNGSRYHRLLSLNDSTVMVDCFRVLQILYAAKRLSKKRSIGTLTISCGDAGHPVVFAFPSGVRAALMPFYARRVPRTSKIIPIEEVIQ